METTKTTPAVQGLIISLLLIVFGLGVHFAGLSSNKNLNYIQYLLLAGGIIWACFTYSKQRDGNVTFGNTFAHGFKTTAAITAVMAVYTVLALKFITPEIVDIALDEARKGMMEQKGKMSDSDISDAIDMTRKFFIPFAIAGVVVLFLIFGCIFSLIGAAIAKKNPNYNPLEN